MPFVILDRGTCQAEMFLDGDTMRAFILMERVPWYDKGDYRCAEPDPSTFPMRWATGQRDLPLKYVDSDGYHRPAAEGYARALRAGKVNGPPKYLLKAELPPDAFLHHVAKGDIRIWPEMHTVAFTKPMNNDNYPQIKITGADINDNVGHRILEAVYKEKPYLMKKRNAEDDIESDGEWPKKLRKTTENQSAAEEDTSKILPVVLQFIKSQSAELETMKNQLERDCARGTNEKIIW